MVFVRHILLRLGRIGDLTLAHPPGTGLAHADDIQDVVGIQFADHGANFGGANLQADNYGRGIKHFSFWFELV